MPSPKLESVTICRITLNSLGLLIHRQKKKVAIIVQLCMNKELETAQYATRNRDLRYQSVTNCTIGLMSLNFFDPPFLHLQNQAAFLRLHVSCFPSGFGQQQALARQQTVRERKNPVSLSIRSRVFDNSCSSKSPGMEILGSTFPKLWQYYLFPFSLRPGGNCGFLLLNL